MDKTPKLNLIVLRVDDIDSAAAFYSKLGVAFTKHAHGAGPVHCAAEMDGLVFELYPATPQQPVSTSTRVGFAVRRLDDVVGALCADSGGKLHSPPNDSAWGRRAVVIDPDGHRVELVEVETADPMTRSKS